MFEPIHGSAPRMAGKGIANPMAAIWAAAQMLDFFGHKEWAAKVICAIENLLVQASPLTPDVGGNASTQDVGDAIVSLLQSV